MPKEEKGSYSKVFYKEEVLGYALRSKNKTNPIFVSPGHLCSISKSLEITLNSLKTYKLPEPTRIADLYSKKLKNSATDSNEDQLSLL
jgi:deoxyribonuclease V